MGLVWDACRQDASHVNPARGNCLLHRDRSTLGICDELLSHGVRLGASIIVGRTILSATKTTDRIVRPTDVPTFNYSPTLSGLNAPSNRDSATKQPGDFAVSGLFFVWSYQPTGVRLKGFAIVLKPSG